MSEKYYTEAVCEALRLEMQRDENVILMGIDVKAGIWGTGRGLFDEFGPLRVIDTPVCEGSFAMAGVGAAMTGLRPVVEFMFAEYVYLAMEAIANVAGQWSQISNGVIKIPMVIQAFSGPRGNGAYAHSQSTQSSVLNVPGLKIVVPSSPADAKGLTISAIQDEGLVIVFHDKELLSMTGEVPEGEHLVPIGSAMVQHTGNDITLISFGAMVHCCLKAAQELEQEGINAEVIDLRTLVPLDEDTIARSIQKTNALIVVESGRKRGGVGSEIAAVVAEKYIDVLDGPIVRVKTIRG
jgi:pyruvate dehydrogenase E1 component beta subunit